MLDITIGQYYPGNSMLYRTDPRTKLIVVIVYIIVLFVWGSGWGVIPCIVFLFLGYAFAKIPVKLVFKSLKPMLPIIIFTAILNIFFVEGDPIFTLGFISISMEGIVYAIRMVLRFACLIAATSLLTYTTTPIALTDAIEILLGPLKKIKVPVHELAMMMTIALRFIPLLVDETNKIMNAQKARGADMESGNIIQRAKATIPILIPLFVSAFRRAEELAMAMECRCYHGDEGRTRMKVLRMGKADAIMWIWMAVFCALAYFANTIPLPTI